MYTDKDTIENYLAADISAPTAQVNEWIEAMTRQIERETNRVFKATASEERVFSGNDTKELLIDDATDITKVERGSGFYGELPFLEVSEDRYILQPDNHEKRGVPVTSIILLDGYWQRGVGNHKITAKWGYSEEVPEDIKFAATVMVAGIIQFNQQDSKKVKSERIGEYNVTYANSEQENDLSRAREVLQKYKKIYL